MLYLSHTPSPPLGDFIERFWLCSDAPPHSRERILPSGTIELVVNLRDDEIRVYDPSRPDRCTRYSGAVVSGTYSRFFVIDPLQHASIAGVHFRPGGAFPFLGAPAGELADAHVDLEILWGRAAAELRERLCAAGTPEQRFSLLENALLARLRHPPEHHGSVPVALDAFERGAEGRVRDVAGRVGLSQRRFIQVFAAEVGMTPKLYSRVRRFQRARALAQSAVALDWARVAVESGYFDQSHLIRDFLEFSGLSPGDYLRRRSEQVLPNHVPQAQ
ncbi:MAG TPA: helix-turn-helix domain-containing protein [Thermoanaerobaculia bacterium]|nr:helix-turn-helix domain-containing protein [Thermoanaerobaculia bacterium]